MRKPKVGDVSKWNWTYWQKQNDYNAFSVTEVSVGEADNFRSFYKVIIHIPGKTVKPKYFYGEMAWADVNRYVSDTTGWIWFDLQEGGLYV